MTTSQGVGESNDEDIALLEEILRQAERVLDQQVAASEELKTKAEHLMGIGIAALAAAAAVGAYVAERICGPEVWVLLPLSVGAVLNFWSLIRLADCYLGTKGHIEEEVPPKLAWLDERAADDTWTLMRHYRATIGSARSAFESNARQAEERIAARRLGLRLLIFAVALYGGSVALYATATISRVVACP